MDLILLVKTQISFSKNVQKLMEVSVAVIRMIRWNFEQEDSNYNDRVVILLEQPKLQFTNSNYML